MNPSTPSIPSLPSRADALLRERGMRVTVQRRLILSWFLDHPNRHMTAEQIRNHLLETLPELARGTTYKALAEMVRAGLLEELSFRDSSIRYGLALTPHHHFLCRQCSQWFDVPENDIGLIELSPSAMPNFTIEKIGVILRGLCVECQEPPPSLHD